MLSGYTEFNFVSYLLANNQSATITFVTELVGERKVVALWHLVVVLEPYAVREAELVKKLPC